MLSKVMSAMFGSGSLMKPGALSSRCLMTKFIIAAAFGFCGPFSLGPILAAFCRGFGFYTVVQERQCKVYMLFGKVALVLDEPGLHFLWFTLGWKAPLVNWIGRCHV